ncbi:MAG TPA: peptide ABC transporter substrate-binding protein [Gaiellaceae bacterium]|jgi:oligopeptide transport system substrate-binding protein|nr:peptide ABC transporter substrate-binding protein [Gaiellaceae bacterium]
MRSRRIVGLAAIAAAVALTAAACGGGDDGGGEPGAVDGVITVNWGSEPPSLDPGLASDTTSSNIITNIMDPLVKLGADLEPVPNLAESWEMSPDGKTVTFTLRPDGRWTTGDPVVAEDFEWSWKRTISPELAADYAYQFFGIVGAAEYNACESNCEAAREKVGVEAVDERTLRVQLTTPQPWFVQQVAHHSFLAVHRPTVEQFGERWTEADNIVTNGPFRLARWDHNSRIDLVKWEEWRNAGEVSLQRVNGRMISEGLTAVQAFEADEIDATTGGLPPEELPRLKDLPEYQQYPSLGTYYYGVNVENVPDVNQRRAMALAIDRRSIIDNVAQADQLPASGFTPQGMPGFESINPESEYLPETADLDRAKELMEQVENPNRNVTLVINDAPGHREIAVAVQSMWAELGIETEIQQQEWAQFLESIGPPPGNQIDAFRLGWIGDYVDAMNFLELWTCESGNNSTNYCNEEYDRLVEQARQTPDDAERYALYNQLEEILFGPEGDVPLVPIYWYTFVQLEDQSIQDTFNTNLLDQIDLTAVEEKGADGDGEGDA